MKNLILRYRAPAEDTIEGWEKYSLPLGNGYFGASVFGGVQKERIQFTTNAFANVYKKGGVSSFAEVYLDFGDVSYTDYERGLSLSDATAFSSYRLSYKDGSSCCVKRTAFVSYPDKAFVYRVSDGSRKANFSVLLEIPYLNSRSAEEGGREGHVCFEDGALVMRGVLPSRDLTFEGRLSVLSDGTVVQKDGGLFVSNASETTIIFTLDTSYRLCEETFLDGCHKALGDDPHNKVVGVLNAALSLGFDRLFARHTADYRSLMNRVTFDLGAEQDNRTVDELLNAYRSGESVPYLEELYYAYGRYLLIASSRKGSLPASLQGVWSAHDKSPWGSGFWHNINIQMNYWHAFSSNLAETFEAYVDFAAAYRKQAEKYASEFILRYVPENYDSREGECGWTIGTAAFAYEIEGSSQHSGPGTGGLTCKLFKDYYEFTKDEVILRDVVYPSVHGMAKFFTKCVKNYDGRYLSAFSASPEQILSGHFWVNGDHVQKYYHTVGCAFDQQMIYENACDDLYTCELLHIEDETTSAECAQIDAYDPVHVGYSGQIKEYEEEHFYGEIGEEKHRHISQLVALMPGTLIGYKTPAWLDAARLTLDYRGDESTGWALAHRLCARARTGEGDRAYKLLKNLLTTRTHPNLWDVHPPFQIDGNFGAVAGMTEMLLQSHEGYIHLLPSVPHAWKNLSFSGLKARGNFTVSCVYKDGKIEKCSILSVVGGSVGVKAKGAKNVVVCTEKGKSVQTSFIDGVLRFDTKKGCLYTLQGFEKAEESVIAEHFSAEWKGDGVHLTYRPCDRKFAVLRAVGDDANYTQIGFTSDGTFVDEQYSENKKARITYKLIEAKNDAVDAAEIGALACVHPATKLEEERYKYRFKQLNLK